MRHETMLARRMPISMWQMIWNDKNPPKQIRIEMIATQMAYGTATSVVWARAFDTATNKQVGYDWVYKSSLRPLGAITALRRLAGNVPQNTWVKINTIG